MIDLAATGWAMGSIGAVALAGWVVGTARRDVSIVDALWSMFFLLSAGAYAWRSQGHVGPRCLLVLVLCALWALRLSAHILVRSAGQAEDRRYRAIRARNAPHFAFKSLYLVFGLQGLLAFVIGLPLYAALTASRPIGALDACGAGLWVLGFVCEAVADWQLMRFRALPDSSTRVLDRGLWRFSRHPNYFGECLIWWGYFLIAAAGGAWWTVISPLVMTWLLLRVSGVTLLESDIRERRATYSDYVKRTSAFIPWFPRGSRLTVNAACRRSLNVVGLAALVSPLLGLVGCRTNPQPPIKTVQHVELPRFMGDWYVIANIPTWIERDAYNAVESYALRPDGTIATTFTFRAGGFDGPRRVYHPRGFVLDHDSNAVWGMRFVWPFKADYRIVYLAPDYSITVVGREARDYVWIMARGPSISAEDYARLEELIRSAGYDISKLRRVPQRGNTSGETAR
jgi:steroid 5-alpha reductase family enzyme/lipocalin